MLSTFDWIRLCQTGAELLATLELQPGTSGTGEDVSLASPPSDSDVTLGPPISALNSPCQRCWIYPRVPWIEQADRYCGTCRTILTQAQSYNKGAARAVIVWGFVNQLPRLTGSSSSLTGSPILSVYIHDAHHFLMAVKKRQIKPCLQELVLYHGGGVKGLFQIFPGVGASSNLRLGEVICRAAHHETRFAMDQLRVRFYSAAYQLLRPHEREKQGILTFEISEFLGLLEMARVFRTLVRPQEQQMLRDLLEIKDARETQFYWGRFQGMLDPEVRDMLTAWRIRQWPQSRIRLLYELMDYVVYDE